MARSSRALRAALVLALAAPMTAVPIASAFADRRSESMSSYQRAFRQFERNDFRTARIELLKALKADPNNPLARLLNARAGCSDRL
jgi:Tfp pilus assembly protein PilF